MKATSHDTDPPQENRVDAQHWPKTNQRTQTEADQHELLETCAKNAAGNSELRSAQPPEESKKARIGHSSHAAAGIPAILKSMQYGLDEMGVDHAVKTLLKVNQKDGFD